MSNSRFTKYLGGLALAFAAPWLILIIIPYFRLSAIEPVPYPEGAEVASSVYPPMTTGEVKMGSMVYSREGCAYCHTQMVRPTYAGADMWLPGWGGRESEGLNRETQPADYLRDSYAQLGYQRIGPDLSNVGWRTRRGPEWEGKIRAWHHVHLYNARIFQVDSVMPAYKHLYEKRKVSGQPSKEALELPEEFAPPAGYEVVPTVEAEALVDYLMSRKMDAPIPDRMEKAGEKAGGGEAK